MKALWIEHSSWGPVRGGKKRGGGGEKERCSRQNSRGAGSRNSVRGPAREKNIGGRART